MLPPGKSLSTRVATCITKLYVSMQSFAASFHCFSVVVILVSLNYTFSALNRMIEVSPAAGWLPYLEEHKLL